MTTHADPPLFPAGEFVAIAEYDDTVRNELIQSIAGAPKRLSQAVAWLDEAMLDTLYKNWTIRQIVHHVADSHLHSIIRFKWALTEDQPTIKAYEEGDWAELRDSKRGDIQPALDLLEGLHGKWVQLLTSLTREEYGRTFHHPQSQETVPLWLSLNLYAWHARHHTAQILWLRDRHGWGR